MCTHGDGIFKSDNKDGDTSSFFDLLVKIIQKRTLIIIIIIASCLAFRASIAKEGYKMRSRSVFVAPEDEASSFWKRRLKEIVVVVVVVKKTSSSTTTTASDIPSINAFLRARPTRPPATTRPRPFPKNRATFDILRAKKKNKNVINDIITRCCCCCCCCCYLPSRLSPSLRPISSRPRRVMTPRDEKSVVRFFCWPRSWPAPRGTRTFARMRQQMKT